jgi:hypothetical protein
MASPHSWGPIEKPMGREHESIGAEGEVTLSTAARFEGSPIHPVRYDATDSRHNYETGQRPWASVDVNSGHTSDTDFGTLTGRFEDGPGVWRQT